jgi:hypothetical protein
MKKTWRKPKLVVLFRGRPEEYVLSACKSAANPSGGATDIQSGAECLENLVNCDPCVSGTGT